MKKWFTIQNWGEEICKDDVLTDIERKSGKKELNAAQGSQVASAALKLYKSNGVDGMLRDIKENLRDRMPGTRQSTGFTVEEKNRVVRILKKQFRWHWFPFSKIQFNMRRLTK